ncbi:hypothetical protein AVEN_218603-1 [Araneus ventricosus]|uniref:Uncharacterized protein n=1 Tax=Araneus ventricosus TaxID=182803 RepID=A0A4Y2TFD5_ARAVE|nr:hypothetical protein AVEN_218603-1 [Araneus ventricosus]
MKKPTFCLPMSWDVIQYSRNKDLADYDIGTARTQSQLPEIVHPKQPRFADVANVNPPKCNGKSLFGGASFVIKASPVLAIHRNLDSVHAMRHAIWAIFMHKLFTDENPHHGFCPTGEDSKRLKLQGVHKNNLPVAVIEAMCPVFKYLSHPDLLKKCAHGDTQNPNESVDNVIWSRVPKSTFVPIRCFCPEI